ncbi:MAG TPA: M20/M25/M40 family metallo-hydrolase, partial [Phnomibacter sp.]|nr:M20/M25/M40 family metallo-hydrolase [Phnomibacter sp.]
MKKFFLFLLLAILVLSAVLVVKTVTAPKATFTTAQPLPALPDSAVAHLQQAIQSATISWGETKPIDTAAFRQFDVFLHQSYPLIHQRLSRMVFGEFSYLYKWQGTDSTLNPIILMGHYDVVPVEAVAEKMWRQKPFSGALVSDTVWGRGACDDKGAVVSILESVEGLLRSGYQPKRTIYLSFGHDEELGGPRGAAKIAAHLKAEGVKAE